MRLKTVMATSILAIWPIAADAEMSTEQRVPTSAPIPCRGRLKELFSEGGNIYGISYELSLTCEEAGKISWTLRSSAGCYVDEGLSEDGKTCSGPAMEPVGSFVDKQADERVFSYKIVKYVFARYCDPVLIHKRSLQADTNITRFDETEKHLLCKKVTAVDGTLDRGYEALKPELFKYTSVKTDGGTWEMVDGPDRADVLGTQTADSNYGLAWTKGVMRREDH